MPCSGVWWTAWVFPSLQIRVFWEFTYASSVMYSSWGSTSPSCTFFSIQLQNGILCGASTGLKACTTLTLHGRNFINLVALKAEPTDTSVSCDNRLRDFRKLIFNRARMSSSFLCVSTVFLWCRVLSSTDPVVSHFLISLHTQGVNQGICGWIFPCTWRKFFFVCMF
jgi:hypothetical protein